MLSNKIKIAYLISYLPKQGPVQVIYDIVKNIDFSKFDVIVITLKNEEEYSLITQFKNLPIEIVQLESTYKYQVFKLERQLRVVLKVNGIQILHSHCTKSLFMSWLVCNVVVKFHTVHIYPGLQLIATNGYFVGNIINYFTKQLIRKIDYPISCSESLKSSLFQKDKIFVDCIQNGVSPLSKPNISKFDLKKKLNLDPEVNYFISVGRFSREKNFLFLVEQFMRLNLKQYKLLILGDGPLFNEVLSISDDSIILTGFRQNVSDYLFASDYYLSSSLTEGMPLSVLEAMSAGLPLVLSDIEPHIEILKKARTKKIGLTFKNNNQVDFEMIIESLLQMNYLYLCENVNFVYEEYFSAKKMSNEYQKLYLNAINKK